ncbi:synaptic vesicle 2-related protein-like isoform X2 [Galleria mellonella]|uniref:Synaptic vesicle 2-related protein-like isoform X2 n=1 Tax=Galleria mellonella TaxID=7137 RepID=A0ABM3N3G5_GALME|nr:synaptic vesicle 2-related protein-like isoform X2 [Galleria mellonella]
MISENVNSEKVPFEVAIDKTGFGLYSYILAALTGLVIVSYGCIGYGSTIIVPSSACELNTTSAQQGLLVSAPIIGAIIGAILWGYVADRHGRRSMLLVSLLSSSAINAVASLSVNWIMLLILQFIATLSSSGQYTISMTILCESVPMAKRNTVLLLVTSIFLMAQGIMAALAMPVIPLTFSYHLSSLGIYWNSWRTLILVYSIPSLVCAAWLMFMQESPKYTLAQGDEERTIQILRLIHRINNRNTNEELQVKGILQESLQVKTSTKNQILPLFKRPLVKYTLIMTILSVFHQVTAFGVWLPTIANKYVKLLQTGQGSDLTLCGIYNADIEIAEDADAVPCALNITALVIVLGVGALNSIINILISVIVVYTGRRNTVIVIAAFSGTSGTLINLVPNAIVSLVLFGIYLMAMMLIGLYTAISVALFPTNLRALAVSLTMTGVRIGSFASIQILKFLLVNNCEVGFYVYASILTLSAVVASFLPNDRLLMQQKEVSE